MISQSLDSKMLPWLEIPTTQPQVPTQGHLGTCHTVISVKKKKKRGGGIEGGKQKYKKNANNKNNR